MSDKFYSELGRELNEKAMRASSRRSLRQWFVDNWIALVALIVAIIALFK